MQRLAAVLLRHTAHRAAAGTHYDLMLGRPDTPLWTARVPRPSAAWAAAGALVIEPLGEHRPAYLTRQGPIGGGRGAVLRVDRGSAVSRLWTADRAVIELELRGFVGLLRLRRLSPTRLLAVFDPRAC